MTFGAATPQNGRSPKLCRHPALRTGGETGEARFALFKAVPQEKTLCISEAVPAQEKLLISGHKTSEM